MAVTGAIFKALTFNGESSRDYGVYITGEAVYNAPSRDVEMITIPGRNGSFPLDHGRFENIEVTYPAGVFADNEADFADAISDFRNMLCSASGYCRLEDEYNPDEYRLAVYKSGLEVEPAALKAGEFEITFECQPQRFLKSGETATTVANNGTITNPTRFASSPLLEVKGYGDINLGSQKVTVNNTQIGYIDVSSPYESDLGGTHINRTLAMYLINTNRLNVGDTINVSGIKESFSHPDNANPPHLEATITYTTRQNLSVNGVTGSRSTYFTITYDTHTIYYGTSTSWTARLQATTTWSGGSESVDVTASFSYNGSDLLTITFSGYVNGDGQTLSVPAFAALSTKPALGDPTYVDLEIGEAYMIDNDEIIALNNVVQLPPVLPTLPIGTTTVTYSNTITDLKVIPRWWKV